MGRQTLAKKPRCYFTGTSLLICTLLITGCSSRFALPILMKRTVVPKTEIIHVETGSINISPPPGFCIDDSASKNTDTSVFMIFANCGYINSNGRRANRNAAFNGLVTTSVAKTAAFQNAGDLDLMSDYLSSEDGLKSLSTSGKAKSIAIIDKRQTADGVFLQLQDQDATLSKTVWKSFLNRSEHLVTVTLLQNENTDIEPEQAMQFLQSYSETIVSSSDQVEQINGASIPKSDPTPAVDIIQPERRPAYQKNKLKKVGFLRRLLL